MSSDYGDFCREQREHDKIEKQHYDDKVWPIIDRKIQRLRQLGFLVEETNSHYQIRVNGRLDIYPYNQRYHDIKHNRRGDFRDFVGFTVEFFKRHTLLK